MKAGLVVKSLAVLFALFVVALGTVYSWYMWCDDLPRPSQVEKSINKDIHPGATLEEIQQYLDEKGIDHNPPVAKASQFSDLDELPPDTPVYPAIMRGDGLSAISIYFILDEQLRFVRLIVKYHPPL